MHVDRSGSDTYSPSIHLTKITYRSSISTQEVDGCPGDGSLSVISLSKNRGKTENGVSQTDSVSRISLPSFKSILLFTQKGNMYQKPIIKL